jgi:hypothetical protein
LKTLEIRLDFAVQDRYPAELSVIKGLKPCQSLEVINITTEDTKRRLNGADLLSWYQDHLPQIEDIFSEAKWQNIKELTFNHIHRRFEPNQKAAQVTAIETTVFREMVPNVTDRLIVQAFDVCVEIVYYVEKRPT